MIKPCLNHSHCFYIDETKVYRYSNLPKEAKILDSKHKKDKYEYFVKLRDCNLFVCLKTVSHSKHMSDKEKEYLTKLLQNYYPERYL